MECPEDFERVEVRLNRVLTQYRESPKLLHMIRTYLRQVEIIEQSICAIPEMFSLDSAVGDQLTKLGLRMGFPRVQCVCQAQPVFGFACPPGFEELELGLPIVGFCEEAEWVDCVDAGVATISVDDDEVYRRMLKARRYQIMAYFDRDSLIEAIEILFGETAIILDSGHGRVVVAPGRDLTDLEMGLIQLFARVVPVGLGIDLRFHFGPIRVFGFGDGWGGFCEGTSIIGSELLTEASTQLLTEQGQPIFTDEIGIGADWMCAIDVRPYQC